MRLYVPSIGTELQLTADWTFPCFCESRNIEFIRKMRPDVPDSSLQDRYGEATESFAITIPAGSVLSIQRIYIRNGGKEWDSVTFSLKRLPSITTLTGKPKKNSTKKASGRFWVKLGDANEIHFTTPTVS